MTQPDRPLSPLGCARAAFRLLTTGPQPLAVDGRRIGGTLPRRRIPLDELTRLLLRPSTGARTRDAAWVTLVTNARRRGPSWVIGAVGVAMPALRKIAGNLSRGYDGDTADIDAEVLTGFLAALASVDLSRPAIALRLRWAAYRAGAAFRYADAAAGTPREIPVAAVPPPRPWGHPDLVLADAVAQGVISAADAGLIAATRLESVPLTAAARHLRVPYDAARMRRSRAESRVAQAISDERVKSRVFG